MDFWNEEDKEEKKYRFVIKILLFMNMFLFLIISILIIWTNKKVDDLENKIDDLEQRNLEVHEYILNRIGG